MDRELTTKQTQTLVGLVLLGITALAFAVGALGDFVYDDAYLIVGNSEIQQLGNLARTLTRPFWDLSGGHARSSGGGLYYRPFVTFAYTIQYQLFGEEPLGYHLVNLTLHVLATWLAFKWLVRRVGQSVAANAPSVSDVLAAGLGVVLFAWHPTRVESVTWIAGSTDLWMGVFVLLALHALDASHKLSGIVLSSLCLLLAFASKESTIVVPVWMLLDAWLCGAPGQERSARIRAASCVLGVMLGALALRVSLLPLPSTLFGGVWLQLPARVLSTLGEFLRVIIWPWPGSVLRALQHRGPDGYVIYSSFSALLGALVVACALSLAWAALRKPALRPWLADAALLLCTLAPVLNIVPLGVKPQVAERFLYLPMLGLAALVARALSTWLRGAGEAERKRATLVALSAPLLMAMIAGTVTHSQDFMDEQTLWEHEVSVQPNEALPTAMLARHRVQARRFEEGLALALHGYTVSAGERMVRLNFVLLAARALVEMTPDADQDSLRALASFYDDLAALRPALLQTPRLRLAWSLRKQELPSLYDEARSFAVPSAFVHARLLRFDEARAILESSVRKQPNDIDAQQALALIEARSGDFAKANELVDSALRRWLDNPQLLALRGLLSRAQQRSAQRGPDPAMNAVTQAHAYLMLAAPGMAAAVLDRALSAAPMSPYLISMRAKIDAVDGVFPAARARVAQARAQLPEAEELWSATLQEIDMVEAQRAAAKLAAAR